VFLPTKQFVNLKNLNLLLNLKLLLNPNLSQKATTPEKR
jgi:hypothetical protein